MSWLTPKRLTGLVGTSTGTVFAGFSICKVVGNQPTLLWSNGALGSLAFGALVGIIILSIHFGIVAEELKKRNVNERASIQRELRSSRVIFAFLLLWLIVAATGFTTSSLFDRASRHDLLSSLSSLIGWCWLPLLNLAVVIAHIKKLISKRDQQPQVVMPVKISDSETWIEKQKRQNKQFVCVLAVFYAVLLGVCFYWRWSQNCLHSEYSPFTTKTSDTVSDVASEALAHRSLAYLRAEMPLSATALTYGKQQVECMLTDRPAMRQCVTAGDPIYTYAVRMFAGAAAGTPIAWHSEPPVEADADHIYPTPDHSGYIRVSRICIAGKRAGQACTSEELWRAAIFELNNIRNARAFWNNQNQAYANKIDKNKYIERITRLEYKALQECLEVYGTLWVPCMQNRGITATPSVWRVDLPPTYEEWIALYTDHNSYPWNPYGKYFDDIASVRSEYVK